MADLKISQPTGASTPLAGTEVLPIVQSGSTVKVSVANLTVGRAVATAGGSFTDNITQSTAAKGVNFTANTPAAGMTSQLLNWYEEGNYTGTLTPTTSGTITVNAAANRINYTRTGRVVYISGFLEIDSVSLPIGTDVLLNLPFAISNLAKDSGRGGTAIFAKGALRAVTGYNSGTSVYITIDASTLITGDQFYISFNYIAA